jgi:hypothetical protein
VKPADVYWAKQPYHAAEKLPLPKAKVVVRRGIQSASILSRKCIADIVKEFAGSEFTLHRAAILVGTGMPDWTVEQILSVHIRMHKAEGELFRNALVKAAAASKLSVLTVPERELQVLASRRLRLTPSEIAKHLVKTGKKIGPPWGRDQKDAALAAWTSLA